MKLIVSSRQWLNTSSGRESVLTLTCPHCGKACILRNNSNKCSVCKEEIDRSELKIINEK